MRLSLSDGSVRRIGITKITIKDFELMFEVSESESKV